MEELEDTQAQLEHWKRTVTQLEEEARRREEQLSVATENLTAVQARPGPGQIYCLLVKGKYIVY